MEGEEKRDTQPRKQGPTSQQKEPLFAWLSQGSYNKHPSPQGPGDDGHTLPGTGVGSDVVAPRLLSLS